MTFYSEMVDTAYTEISTYGRAVTVNRTKTDTDKANPWEGKTTSSDTFNTYAVFDKEEEKKVPPTLVKKDHFIAYVPTKNEGFSIRIKDEIVDNSMTYKVIDMEIIKPGDTAIMYKLYLRK